MTATQELRIAPLRRRVCATFVDVLLVSVLAGVFNYLAYGKFDVAPAVPETSVGLVISASENFVFMAIVIAITAAFTGSSGAGNGQTPGKRLLRVRILLASGDPLPRRTAFERAATVWVLWWVPSLIGMLVDAGLASPPTWTLAGACVTFAFGAATLIAGLRGTLRQTPYDLRYGTIVAKAERRRPAAPQLAPDAVPVFVQAPTVDRMIVGRERAFGSWFFGGLAIAGVGAYVAYVASGVL